MQFSISFIPDPTGDPSITSGKVLVNVFDDQGNPTDGNNVKVYYVSLENGVVTGTHSVVIPGQSVIIYDGIVATGGTLLTFSLNGEVANLPINPPVVSDLQISSVDIIQKADSSGANGTVRINASSSFLPISYFIDDIPIDYPTFAGISSGAHVAKVVDATTKEVTFTFNVPQISSILLSDPSVTAAGGKISRWNAAFNPIVFTYQRKDFDVTGITQDDTTLKPKIVINADLTGLAVGDYVYLDAGIKNTLSAYKGAYKVLVIINTSTIVIDTDYIAPDSISGFANIDVLRPYYKVITRIKYVNPVTGLFETIESTNRPINGITRADISSLLQSILKPQPDLSNYTAANYRDMGLAASYQISYAEAWEGNSPEYTSIVTPYYVVYAAMQLQQFGGGNMFDFVTQSGGTQLAKWLTDFAEPSYSTGYPFDLPFIYSEKIAGQQIYYKIVALDINRNPLGGGTYTSFILNEDGSYILNQDGTKLIIARQELVNSPIVEYVGLNRLLINQDFGPDCYFLSVQLFYDDDTDTPIEVTKEIIVRIDTVYPAQPVYLRWIGLNGGYNYFRFNYNQTKTLDVQNPVIVKDYVFDWQNTEGIERKISNDASEKLQLYADPLSKNDIDGLQSIKYSPFVQILTQNNPIKWQTIVVNSSTFTEYDTQNEYYEFGITLNMPSKNIQNQ